MHQENYIDFLISRSIESIVEITQTPHLIISQRGKNVLPLIKKVLIKHRIYFVTETSKSLEEAIEHLLSIERFYLTLILCEYEEINDFKNNYPKIFYSLPKKNIIISSSLKQLIQFKN